MHETKNKTFMRLNTFVFLAEFPNSDGHDGDFLDSSPLASVLHSMRSLLFHCKRRVIEGKETQPRPKRSKVNVEPWKRKPNISEGKLRKKLRVL